MGATDLFETTQLTGEEEAFVEAHRESCSDGLIAEFEARVLAVRKEGKTPDLDEIFNSVCEENRAYGKSWSNANNPKRQLRFVW